MTTKIPTIDINRGLHIKMQLLVTTKAAFKCRNKPPARTNKEPLTPWQSAHLKFQVPDMGALAQDH